MLPAMTARYALADATATITLDRDQKRNAFDTALSDGVRENIFRAEQDGARAIVLRANAGAKVWSAGHDLAEMAEHGVQDHDDEPYFRMVATIRDTPLPVIAAIHAPVLAGGMLVAMVADITVATPAATATMTANRMGVPFRASFYAAMIQAMGLKKAKELMLTAAPLSAAECLRCGLYNHVVAPEALDGTVAGIVARIASLVPEGIAHSKRSLNAIAWAPGLPEHKLARMADEHAAILASPGLKGRVGALLASLKR